MAAPKINLADTVGLSPTGSAPRLQTATAAGPIPQSTPGSTWTNTRRPRDMTQAQQILDQFVQQAASQAGGGVLPVQTPDFAKSLGMTEDIFRQANQAVQSRQAAIQQATGALPGQLEAQTAQALGTLDARLQAALGAGADSMAAGPQGATEGMVAAGVLPFQQAIEQSGLGMQALVPTMQAGAQQFASEQELQLNALRAQQMAAIQDRQAQMEFEASLQAQRLSARDDQEPAMRREDVTPGMIHPDRVQFLSPGRLQDGLDRAPEFDALLEANVAAAEQAGSKDALSDAVTALFLQAQKNDRTAIDMSVWLHMRPQLMQFVR